MSPKSAKSSEEGLDDKIKRIDQAIEFNTFELELLADFYMQHGHEEEAQTLLETITKMKLGRKAGDSKSVA